MRAAGAARRHGPLPAASCYGSTEMSYIGQVQRVPLVHPGGLLVAVLFFVAFSFFTRTVLATMPPIILSLVSGCIAVL